MEYLKLECVDPSENFKYVLICLQDHQENLGISFIGRKIQQAMIDFRTVIDYRQEPFSKLGFLQGTTPVQELNQFFHLIGLPLRDASDEIDMDDFEYYKMLYENAPALPSQISCDHCDKRFINRVRLQEHVVHIHTKRKRNNLNFGSSGKQGAAVEQKKQKVQLHHPQKVKYSCATNNSRIYQSQVASNQIVVDQQIAGGQQLQQTDNKNVQDVLDSPATGFQQQQYQQFQQVNENANNNISKIQQQQQQQLQQVNENSDSNISNFQQQQQQIQQQQQFKNNGNYNDVGGGSGPSAATAVFQSDNRSEFQQQYQQICIKNEDDDVHDTFNGSQFQKQLFSSLVEVEQEKEVVVKVKRNVLNVKRGVCWFCAEGPDVGSWAGLGNLIQRNWRVVGKDGSQKFVYHYQCARYASCPEVFIKEDGEQDFVAQDLVGRWRQSIRNKCTHCPKGYASMRCMYPSCNERFHYPCFKRACFILESKDSVFSKQGAYAACSQESHQQFMQENFGRLDSRFYGMWWEGLPLEELKNWYPNKKIINRIMQRECEPPCSVDGPHLHQKMAPLKSEV